MVVQFILLFGKKPRPGSTLTTLSQLTTCTVYMQQEIFEGEIFCECSGFVAIRENFLCEIWGMVSFGTAKVSNPRKFSPRKSCFTPICESFLPRKLPVYGICLCMYGCSLQQLLLIKLLCNCYGSISLPSQGLTLRGWIDLTCGRETFVKKSIKFFEEALAGYVLYMYNAYMTIVVNFRTTAFLV